MATILSITVQIDKRLRRPRQACARRYGGNMSTEITVRGSFSAFQPPERGTVNATVAYEGPEMEPVYDRVARDLEALKSSIVPLKDEGIVTWWSADQLRAWSNRPWNDKGKQLPLVHHASAAVEVKFRDFAALSHWVGQHLAGIEGFRVSHVEWALTAKQRETLLSDVRTRAVRDAVTRAQLVRRRARPGRARAGRHRGRRNAQHASREWAPGRADADGGRQVRLRSPSSCPSTSRCRQRSTRGS